MKIPLFGRRGELAFEVRSKWDGYTIIVIEAMWYLEKQHWSGKENHFRLGLADLDQPAPLAPNPVGKRMKAVLRGCSRSSALTQPARRGRCNIHSSTCRPWGPSPYTWGINSPTQRRWVPAPPKKATVKHTQWRCKGILRRVFSIPCYSTEKARTSGCMKACPFLTGETLPTSKGAWFPGSEPCVT